MKKSIVILSVLLSSFYGSAQRNELINAGIEMKNFNFMTVMMSLQSPDQAADIKKSVLKAKEEIDACLAKQSETGLINKPKDVAKMHYYTGTIYMSYMMFAAIDEDVQKDLEANAEKMEELTTGAYKKSLEANGYYKEDIEGTMNQLRMMGMQGGVQMYQEKKYEEAYQAFASAVEMADVIGVQDTLAMYNAGLAADQTDNYDEALKYYGMAADLGYRNDASVYQLMVQVSNRKHENKASDDTYKIIQAGKAKYPNDLNLTIEEFNYFNKVGETEKAQNALQEAVKADPKNPILHFNIGATFDEMVGKFHEKGDHETAALYVTKAAEAYKKAIELNEKYFDAYYNLGALFYNEAAELNNLANTIEDVKLYEAEKLKAKELFIAAAPHLEKAHDLMPNDVNTLKILKTIYINTENEAAYKVANDKLKALGQ